MPLELFEAALHKLAFSAAAKDRSDHLSEEVLSIAVEVFTSLRYGLHNVPPGFSLAAWCLLIVVI